MGIFDRSGKLNLGEYGLIEINHYDNITDESYWSFAHQEINTLSEFVTRNMNDDSAAILDFVRQVKTLQDVSSTTLIGHSMGTHIAAAVLFPQLQSYNLYGFFGAPFGNELIRTLHPKLDELASEIDRVALMAPYDLSSLAMNAAIGEDTQTDRTGPPSKPFFMFMCGFDYRLPWTGIGGTIQDIVVARGLPIPFDISAEKLLLTVRHHENLHSMTTHDFVGAVAFNAELHPFKDTPDNEETEEHVLVFDNDVHGRVMVTGRVNFETDSFQTCAHGQIYPQGIKHALKTFSLST